MNYASQEPTSLKSTSIALRYNPVLLKRGRSGVVYEAIVTINDEKYHQPAIFDRYLGLRTQFQLQPK